ncbi:hypothetical protein R1flu_011928 [Riccia fluitans]|uniref:SAP domain-containing protein n=1 Tax=Riccia fluitans TaxID=41844 RepID=A0ABD1Z9J5_9MARC
MVTLTRSETGSSWKIETQALELALKILQDKGLTIKEVIHDDNAQVDAILKAHNIVSQKICGTSLKEYCREHDLPQSGSKLQLVQRVSVHLKLLEAGASPDIQRQRALKYPELAAHDIAYKLKSWIYTCAKNATLRGDATPGLLTMDIHNAADHWAGDHTTYSHLPGVRKCVVEKWTGGKEAKYPEGGETHKAVKEFLKKYITETKMKCYIRARENFISEMFHSIINKFATKRIHFDASHTARLACAAMDWNKNISRDIRATYQRASNNTAVRWRAKTNRVLVERTSHWKKALATTVFS